MNTVPEASPAPPKTSYSRDDSTVIWLPRDDWERLITTGLPNRLGAAESSAQHVIQERMKRAGCRWRPLARRWRSCVPSMPRRAPGQRSRNVTSLDALGARDAFTAEWSHDLRIWSRVLNRP